MESCLRSFRLPRCEHTLCQPCRGKRTCGDDFGALVPFQLDPARGSAQRACDWLWGGLVENLVQIVGTALGLGAMLILSSGAIAQTSESQPKQANEARSPWKSYPMDRAVGDGVPAP